MKIKGKLGFGFGCLLIITVIIAVFGIVNMRTNNNNVTLLQDYPTTRYNNLNYMATEIMNLRRLVSVMAFRLGDVQTLTELRGEALSGSANIKRLLDENYANLQSDQLIIPARRDEALAEITDLKQLVERYVDEIIEGMFIAASEGIVGNQASRDRVEEYFVTGASLYEEISDAFSALMEAAKITMDNRYNEINNTTNNTMTVMIVLTLAGVLAGMVIAMVIANAITKPIQSVVVALSELTQGNLNVNIDKSNMGNDETGILTRDVLDLIIVIKAMVSDLTKLDYEYNTNGDIDYRINIEKYQNSFKDMMKGVNNIPGTIVQDVLLVVDALGEINNGKFDLEVKDLPGKKMVLPTAIRTTIANLKSVSDEVGQMIEAAAVNGNLDFQIDEFKYEGDWREIMNGLNRIAAAVDAPITEISDVMSKLSHGDFSSKVTGNYEGAFLSIQESVNNTISTLSSYISEINESLSKVSSGDLTHIIQREYVGSFASIKNSLNNITSTLNKTMAEISTASEQVLSGAKQISISASSLASGAQEQASSVQELNASVDLINQQTHQNANNASNANALSNTSTANAQAGNEAMKNMLEAMEQIKKSSNSISQIIKTIQDIAFQTNLLSLNASVEAARAGEHGKGFSVVADEVRTLATRSQEAVKETEEMIATAISRVEVGAGIAQTTSESLATIVSNATEVLAIINSIAEASREQAEAIGQVSMGLQQISGVVQSNSAVSEETAASSEELSSQAELLKQLVSYFKLQNH